MCVSKVTNEADYFSLSDRTSCSHRGPCGARRWRPQHMRCFWEKINPSLINTSMFGRRCPHPNGFCVHVRLMCFNPPIVERRLCVLYSIWASRALLWLWSRPMGDTLICGGATKTKSNKEGETFDAILAACELLKAPNQMPNNKSHRPGAFRSKLCKPVWFILFPPFYSMK